MESIRIETSRNIKKSTDLDNLRERYYEVSEDGKLKVIFPSGEIYAYDINFFYLVANSELVKFKPRWHQRPDYVSYDYYSGSVNFWSLILFVNRVDKTEDFKGFDYILVPPLDLILEMTKDKTKELNRLKLPEKEEPKDHVYPAVYKYVENIPMKGYNCYIFLARKNQKFLIVTRPIPGRDLDHFKFKAKPGKLYKIKTLPSKWIGPVEGC